MEDAPPTSIEVKYKTLGSLHMFLSDDLANLGIADEKHFMALRQIEPQIKQCVMQKYGVNVKVQLIEDHFDKSPYTSKYNLEQLPY